MIPSSIALSRPCPKCHAPRLQACRDRDGATRQTVHQERHLSMKPTRKSTGVTAGCSMPYVPRKRDLPKYNL